MAYSGPTAVSSLDNLLQALVNWAVANAGFTDEGNITPPSGRTTTYMYRLSKGGMYWYFMGDDATVGGALDSYIEFRLMTALPTAANYSSTTVGPAEITRAQLWRAGTGPYTAYNFFTDGNAVHVVLEVSANVFSHFSFGSPVKFGSWTGGQYTTAWYSSSYTVSGDVGYNFVSGCVPFEGSVANSSAYAGFVYNPVGSFGDYRDFAEIGSVVNNQGAFFSTIGQATASSTVYNNILVGPLFWVGYNAINARAAMFPQYLRLYDSALASCWIGGYVDHVRAVNMDAIDPKQIVETEWEVFPVIQKYGDKTVAPITGVTALAYRRA